MYQRCRVGTWKNSFACGCQGPHPSTASFLHCFACPCHHWRGGDVEVQAATPTPVWSDVPLAGCTLMPRWGPWDRHYPTGQQVFMHTFMPTQPPRHALDVRIVESCLSYLSCPLNDQLMHQPSVSAQWNSLSFSLFLSLPRVLRPSALCRKWRGRRHLPQCYSLVYYISQ